MQRQARCWVCGAVFAAERGRLAPGERFACARCEEDGAARGDHETLARVLLERHGVPFANVHEAEIDPELLRAVPEDFARLHAALPIARKGQAIVVAIADPSGNVFALEHLRRTFGARVSPCVAPWADLQEAIADAYLPLAIAEDLPE